MRRVHVDGFWMDEHPVTVAEFRRFVNDTGYVTLAERAPQADQYPDADPELLVPGSLVFQKTAGPVDLQVWANWWAWTPGACWRHPDGPDRTSAAGSAIRSRTSPTRTSRRSPRGPAASCRPRPSGSVAARGGLEGATYTWGDEFAPKGRMMANTWQGEFPWQNLLTDGYEGTSPVKTFPPNGYGLHDMAGNVWEWTTDFFSLPAGRRRASLLRAVQPAGRTQPGRPRTPIRVDAHIPRRVIKGGSHLCAPNYCLRYRPAARQGEAVDTSTQHIGFRLIVQGR